MPRGFELARQLGVTKNERVRTRSAFSFGKEIALLLVGQTRCCAGTTRQRQNRAEACAHHRNRRVFKHAVARNNTGISNEQIHDFHRGEICHPIAYQKTAPFTTPQQLCDHFRLSVTGSQRTTASSHIGGAGIIASVIVIAPPFARQSIVLDVDGSNNNIDEAVANGTPVGITPFSTDPNGPPVTYRLANNAGGLFARKTLQELDESFYNLVMDVNFKSTVFVMQAFEHDFPPSGSQSITNNLRG